MKLKNVCRIEFLSNSTSNPIFIHHSSLGGFKTIHNKKYTASNSLSLQNVYSYTSKRYRVNDSGRLNRSAIFYVDLSERLNMLNKGM